MPLQDSLRRHTPAIDLRMSWTLCELQPAVSPGMVMCIWFKAAVNVAVCEGIAWQVLVWSFYHAWSVRPTGFGTVLWAWRFVIDAPPDS